MTRIVKKSDGYWIIELPDSMDCGPYAERYGDDPDESATAALKKLEYFFLFEFQGLPKKIVVKRRKCT